MMMFTNKVNWIVFMGVALFAAGCMKVTTTTKGNCFRGKLAIQGICMNYVIQDIDNKLDSSMVVANWTHPTTGVLYKNAFALANPCDLPADIKEGDMFTFRLINTFSEPLCITCKAYSPVPDKRVYIAVCR
jgi:hypothetical protein